MNKCSSYFTLCWGYLKVFQCYMVTFLWQTSVWFLAQTSEKLCQLLSRSSVFCMLISWSPERPRGLEGWNFWPRSLTMGEGGEIRDWVQSPKANDTDNLSYWMNHPEEPLSNGVQGASKLANTSLCLGEGNGCWGLHGDRRPFRPSPHESLHLALHLHPP